MKEASLRNCILLFQFNTDFACTNYPVSGQGLVEFRKYGTLSIKSELETKTK